MPEQKHMQLIQPLKTISKLDRVIDLCIIILISPLLLILFIAIVIALWTERRGPIFYRQIMLGQGGRTLKTYQFRTMHSAADHLIDEFKQRYPQLNPTNLSYQPAHTRIGYFLYRTGLDRIPQLLNVLRGDMSLVGIRPLYREQLQLGDAHFRLYQQHRLGIMGLWQLVSSRGYAEQQRIHFDRWYLDHRSTWYDLKIMILSARKFVHNCCH